MKKRQIDTSRSKKILLLIVIATIFLAAGFYKSQFRDSSNDTTTNTADKTNNQMTEPAENESSQKNKASDEKDYTGSVELRDGTNTELSFSYASDWRIKENNGKSIIFDTGTAVEVYVSYSFGGTAPGMITSEEVRAGSNYYKRFEWSPKSGFTIIRYFPQKSANSNIDGRSGEVQFINIEGPNNIIEGIDRKTQIILSTLSF